jgi:hypothetical protein
VPAGRDGFRIQAQKEGGLVTTTMYHLKLRIRFVLSDKIAKQKTWFLLCSGGFAAAPGVSPGG